MKFQKFNNLIYANNNDNSKIIYQNVPCEIIEKPYSTSKKWYMKVKITNKDILNEIQSIDDIFKKIHKDLQCALSNDIIVLKLPYRYNKFECSVYDSHGDLYTCYELENENDVFVDITHACFSLQEFKYLSTWKVLQIKLKD